MKLSCLTRSFVLIVRRRIERARGERGAAVSERVTMHVAREIK